MGIFEIDAFAQGTMAIAEALAARKAPRCGRRRLGRGLARAGKLAAVTHVSTGGGASLEFLEGKTLPGLAALEGA